MSKTQGRVLRLVPEQKQFVTDGNKEPTYRSLRPNPGDVREAEDRGLPIRVSVWDRGRTSKSSAYAHRTSDKPALAFDAEVAELLDAAGRHAWANVTVVHDPCSPDHPQHGGCDGHHGVQGLAEPETDKEPWKKLLIDMAKKFTPA